MPDILYMVTGAPGAGKSTTLTALLARTTPYLAFDIDWLTVAASALAQREISVDPTTWPAYNALWFTLLQSVARNGNVAIFFSPLDPQDVARLDLAPWDPQLAWLLLDCADATRRDRLRARPAWSSAMIEAAVHDGRVLRAQIADHLSTEHLTPDAVADALVQWVERTQRTAQ